MTATRAAQPFAFSKRDLWMVVAATLLAAALRFPALDASPPGPYCDEAAIATTAYSLGLTGHDLAGDRLPLYASHPSFARWGEAHIITQPVYQYFAVPFLLVGGLDIVSLRLASATLGTLAIAATFLLAALMGGRPVATIAALLVAVSPWHMHFSRVGFEAIALPLILALSTWLLLRGLDDRKSALAGTAGMALATYAYPAALLFVPLLLLVFGVAHRRALRLQPRSVIACALLFCVLEVPNLASMSERGRTAEVSILSADLSQEPLVRELRDSDWPLVEGIADQRLLIAPLLFATNYASYFGPSFLFTSGDPNPRHGPNGSGMAYAFTLPLLLVGVGALVRRRREPGAQLALGWLLVAPVAASLTTASPHAIRAIPMLPMLQIVSAFGAVTLFGWLRDTASGWPARRIAAAIVSGVVIVAAPIEIVGFLRSYHEAYPRDSAADWQTGVAAAIEAAEAQRAGHDRILVSPTIFAAYSFILLKGEIDFEVLDASLPINEQLEAFGYRILFPDEHTELGASKDLLILSARDDVSGLEHRELAEFPYPSGAPHLRLIESGPRP